VASGLTDGLTSSTSAQFTVLRQRYVAGLASRWAEIASAEDTQTLLAALHRLAGSAASFGYERLGHCARRAEARASEGNAAALAAALEEIQTEMALLA